MKPKRHLIIPDVQAKPGVPLHHMDWISNYIETKRPDAVICLGDFADMPSLSSYDVGKGSAEGRRYKADLEAAHEAMSRLCRFRINYEPDQMVLTLGNHEQRIITAANNSPAWIGTISIHDLAYADFGWEVSSFLDVKTVDGIQYSHYFTSGPMGRPIGSARALLNVRHNSAVQGHLQDWDFARHKQSGHVGLLAGLCTLHDEEYLGPQGNARRSGIWMLNEVRNGTGDPMFISLDFLKREYS